PVGDAWTPRTRDDVAVWGVHLLSHVLASEACSAQEAAAPWVKFPATFPPLMVRVVVGQSCLRRVVDIAVLVAAGRVADAIPEIDVLCIDYPGYFVPQALRAETLTLLERRVAGLADEACTCGSGLPYAGCCRGPRWTPSVGSRLGPTPATPAGRPRRPL